MYSLVDFISDLAVALVVYLLGPYAARAIQWTFNTLGYKYDQHLSWRTVHNTREPQTVQISSEVVAIHRTYPEGFYTIERLD